MGFTRRFSLPILGFVLLFGAQVAFGQLVQFGEGETTPPDLRHPLVSGFKNVVPRILIDTRGIPVDDKSVWVSGTVIIDGQGVFEDYVGAMDIRGRGNSTWVLGMQHGKKPFRMRLAQAAPLLGLPPERNWILLANYIDGTLMSNAIAFAAGHLLEMPYTQHMLPVEVYFNDEYLGNYMFTEHKEVAVNRIDLGPNGVLLELDTNFDESFKFKSSIYELPVMVQYPDLEDLPEAEAGEMLNAIRHSFEELERVLDASSPTGQDLAMVLDPRSFAQYMVVLLLSTNREVNHPKSLYIHRNDDGPFHMGPIWDFDWAFGFNATDKLHFNTAATRRQTPRAVSAEDGTPNIGGRFLLRVLEHEIFRNTLLEEWERFDRDLLPVLLEYVHVYAETIGESYARDYARWHQTEWQVARSADFDGEVARIADWLERRSAYLTTCIRDMTRFGC